MDLRFRSRIDQGHHEKGVSGEGQRLHDHILERDLRCKLISLDPEDGGGVAEYVEDCEVCCRPWQVRVVWHDDGHADVEVSTLDE